MPLFRTSVVDDVVTWSRLPAFGTAFAPAIWSTVGMALFVAAAGCAPPSAPTFAVHSLVRPLTGPCPTDPGGAQLEFRNEVTSFAATVTGPGMSAAVVARADDGPVVVPEVPPGPSRVAALFGFSGDVPRWRGVSAPFTMGPGEEVAVDVLFARVADLSCARSTTEGPRAFHTATLLKDGTVLVVGGAVSSQDAEATCGSGCRRLEGTASAALYDPSTGVFKPVGNLQSERMFHTAAALADGRVVIAGGTRTALLRPVDAARYPFPIDPTAPVTSVEVYDPKTRAFTLVGDDPGGPRVFAAATTLANGEVIVTGGIPGSSSSRHDLGNALATTTVCGGASVSCRAGPSLARRRAGHLAFTIPEDGTYVWGGSVELDSVDGIEGYHMEFVRDAQANFTLVEVASMQETRNLFFAGSTQYFDFRVLAVGGLQRDRATGAFQLALAEGGGGPVFVFDRSFGDTGGLATGKDVDLGRPAMTLEAPAFLVSAAGLPDRRSALVAGGFTSLAFEPTSTVERFDEEALTLAPMTIDSAALVLREPRGGVTATALGDGSVLLAGGVTTTRALLSTAEVYADAAVPPQAAPLPLE
jgi:hypothetical protein